MLLPGGPGPHARGALAAGGPAAGVQVVGAGLLWLTCGGPAPPGSRPGVLVCLGTAVGARGLQMFRGLRRERPWAPCSPIEIACRAPFPLLLSGMRTAIGAKRVAPSRSEQAHRDGGDVGALVPRRWRLPAPQFRRSSYLTIPVLPPTSMHPSPKTYRTGIADGVPWFITHRQRRD